MLQSRMFSFSPRGIPPKLNKQPFVFCFHVPVLNQVPPVRYWIHSPARMEEVFWMRVQSNRAKCIYQVAR